MQVREVRCAAEDSTFLSPEKFSEAWLEFLESRYFRSECCCRKSCRNVSLLIAIPTRIVFHTQAANHCYVRQHGELAKHLRRHAFSVRRVPISRWKPSFFVLPLPLRPTEILEESLWLLYILYAFAFRACIHETSALSVFTAALLLSLCYAISTRNILCERGSWISADFHTHWFLSRERTANKRAQSRRFVRFLDVGIFGRF